MIDHLFAGGDNPKTVTHLYGNTITGIPHDMEKLKRDLHPVICPKMGYWGSKYPQKRLKTG
jgi:hypothetical protein